MVSIWGGWDFWNVDTGNEDVYVIDMCRYLVSYGYFDNLKKR